MNRERKKYEIKIFKYQTSVRVSYSHFKKKMLITDYFIIRSTCSRSKDNKFD